MNLETIKEAIIKMNDEELNNYMFGLGLLHRAKRCNGSCNSPMTYEKCSNYVDSYCWICYTANCTYRYKRVSI